MSFKMIKYYDEPRVRAFFINIYKVNFTKAKHSISFQSKTHLILLFEAIYWGVVWFLVGTVLCPMNWKNLDTLLQLALSYRISDRVENVSLTEKMIVGWRKHRTVCYVWKEFNRVEFFDLFLGLSGCMRFSFVLLQKHSLSIDQCWVFST